MQATECPGAAAGGSNPVLLKACWVASSRADFYRPRHRAPPCAEATPVHVAINNLPCAIWPATLPCPCPALPCPAEETLAAAGTLRDEPPASFTDRAFDNELNIAVHRTQAAYDRMLFREALKRGW